jgi:hypothetical protein
LLGVVVGLLVLMVVRRPERRLELASAPEEEPSTVGGARPRERDPTPRQASTLPAAAPAIPPRPPATRIPDSDAMDAMKLAMAAHDPNLRSRIEPGLEKAVLGKKTGDCGREQTERQGRPWMFSSVLAMDLQIADDRAVITELLFPTGDERVVGDAVFQKCMREAVVGSEVPCVRCRAGTVTVPYPLVLVKFPDVTASR